MKKLTPNQLLYLAINDAILWNQTLIDSQTLYDGRAAEGCEESRQENKDYLEQLITYKKKRWPKSTE